MEKVIEPLMDNLRRLEKELEEEIKNLRKEKERFNSYIEQPAK